MFHISIWGAWSFVWGTKPTKAPRGDGTVSRYPWKNLMDFNYPLQKITNCN